MIYNISLLYHRKHQPCDAFHVLAGRMVQGHYSRAFTLVAKWENSPEWHISYIITYILQIYMFQTLLNTFYVLTFYYETPAIVTYM